MNNEFACFALLQDGGGVVLIVVLRLDLLILLTVLQVSQKSLYAHLFPYVCVYRENTIKWELEVALMCPSFTEDFIALKGKFWAWSTPFSFLQHSWVSSLVSIYHIPLPCLIFCTTISKTFGKMATVNRRSQQNFTAASAKTGFLFMCILKSILWLLWNFEYCQLWQLLGNAAAKPWFKASNPWRTLIRQPNFSAAIWHRKCVYN